MHPTQAPCWLFVGTHYAGPGTGLSRARFDPATGSLSPFELAATCPDPAFFVVHPDGRRLYACNSGTPGGVTAFALSPTTGTLTMLNAIESAGRGPSQLTLDRTGRVLLDANYGGGYFDVVTLTADGALGALGARVPHEGQGTDPVRQARAYVHCVVVDPANRFALVADLGLDRVYVYRFDAAAGTVAPHDPPYATTAPGSGPRHLAWHPNGRWLYLIEEMGNAITALAWDAETGRLHAQQTVTTLPEGFTDANTAAEILVRADGRFVYASNRGHDSVAVFAIDQLNGRLTLASRVGSNGRTPRYMALDPSQQWLMVANIDSDSIAQFRVDVQTGALTSHGELHHQSRPYGLAFAPAQ
ncbi:MAG: lactonase family protein [Acidobacteriota bacterium]